MVQLVSSATKTEAERKVSKMTKKKIKIYPIFIRIWHWTQVFLLATLAFTGFAVHGSHRLIHFDTAVKVHNVAGIALGLLAFAMFFYYITTGEWKQYKLDKTDRRE